MARFRTASAATSRATICPTFTTRATTSARYRTHRGTPWSRTSTTMYRRDSSRSSSTSTTKFTSASNRTWCKPTKLVTNDHRAVIPSRGASTWVSFEWNLRVLSASLNVLKLKSLLAGAKLVLPPAGEIPQLKPVNMNRPRMPPPPGPPNGLF